MTEITPSGDNSLLRDVIPDRKIGWLERFLGPDNYRVIVNLFKTPASILGFSLILLFVLIAIFAPLIAPPVTPKDPYKIPRDGYSSDPQPMGTAWTHNVPKVVPAWYKLITGSDKWVHLLGTSQGQYDIFYGIIWGTRTAFKTGFMVVIATFLIGTIIGSLSAYYGGVLDMVLMRIVDIFMTLPYILAARIIRGDILSIKERDYVMAARVIGVKDSRILFKHIVPNAIFPTLVYASLAIGDVVLSFAALSFLGIGTPVGYADWGQVLSFARNWIMNLGTYWYIVVWPGLTLVLFVMGWNLLGDALRDVLDPRMRGTN